MTEQATGSRSHLLQILIIALVIIGLGAALYLPSLLQQTPPQSRTLLTAPGCDLTNSSCLAQADGQKVSLLIKTDEIRSAKPMLFEVALGNIKANQVMLDLKGKEMYMGLNQVMMEPVTGENNIWQGEVTLAVCTTGEMTWVTSVVIEEDGKLTQANFEFNAQ